MYQNNIKRHKNLGGIICPAQPGLYLIIYHRLNMLLEKEKKKTINNIAGKIIISQIEYKYVGGGSLGGRWIKSL